jgi:hypothetical protein
MRALCTHLNQATSGFQLSCDPTTFSRGIKPPATSLLLGTFGDVTIGKSGLPAENEVAFERAEALA